MMKRITIAFLLLATLLASTSAQNYCISNRFSNTALFTDAQIQKDSNLVFGVAKNVNNNMDSLRMDIYYPNASVETLSKRPLIVFAFGGGFLGGNRFEMAGFCKEFAKRGYVAATIDYRLGWGCLNLNTAVLCLCTDYIGMYNATYRAAQDFNAALRYLSFKSGQYTIDTNYVFVSGGSAGSITAMNAAFASQAEFDAKLSWVHNTFGHLDSSGNNYPKNYKIRGVLDFCGAVYDTAWMNDNKDIAVVSFHDSVDCVVPTYKDYIINCTGNCQNLFTMMGSALVYTKAIRNGTCAELNINPIFAHCGSDYGYVVRHGACFLKRIMCTTCIPARYKDQNTAANCDSLGFGNGIDSKMREGFEVYPNPANNMIQMEFNASISRDIILYDSKGMEVWSQRSDTNRISIPVSGLSSGIYLISVKSAYGNGSKRIVINR
jgi:dienelactone hydrolase